MTWWLFVFALVFDGTLILRDGKRVPFTDKYEIKDGFVLFHNAQGDLFKLPLDLVDLERTEAASRAVSPPASEPDEKLTGFDKFVAEAKPTEDGKGGRVIVIRSDQQAERSYPIPIEDTPRDGPSPAVASRPSDTGANSAPKGSEECATLPAKISVVEDALEKSRADLAREKAKDNPSERITAALEKTIRDSERYLESLQAQLKACP